MIQSTSKQKLAFFTQSRPNYLFLLLLLLLSTPLSAHASGTAFGVSTLSKVVCENKSTGQKVKSQNVVGSMWNCTDIGLISMPGDIVKQTFKGPVANLSNIGGSVTGITAITKLKCDNKTTQQAINITPLAANWSCNATGLTLSLGDVVKQTITGSVEQPPINPPETPTNFQAMAGDGVVMLSWTPALSAGSTRIYSSTSPFVEPVTANLITETLTQAFTHSGLTNGLTYYYKATSVNAFGESMASVAIAAIPTPLLLDHNTVIGQVCASCHNGVDTQGLPPSHIPTTFTCDDCHVVSGWIPARMDHAGITGLCSDCHNGSIASASGKPLIHIPSSEVCENCHRSTTTWLNALVDHSVLTSVCSSCHDGANASAKPNNHIVTNSECNSCHSTSAWIPAIVDHSSIVGACSVCHNGISATGKLNSHIVTNAECDVCHVTSTWISAIVDHSFIVGACSVCHDGISATGKLSSHIVTNAECDVCHNTTGWI